EAYRFSAVLRRAGIPVVLGGLHATACADEVLQHCDAVVVGEGEAVWHALLADAEAGSLQRIYRAAYPFDLAQAPVPRFDLPFSMCWIVPLRNSRPLGSARSMWKSSTGS